MQVLRRAYSQEAEPPVAVTGLHPDWAVRRVRTLPAPVNALMIGPADGPAALRGLVFAGSSGKGEVCRFNPSSVGSPLVLSEGLGDHGSLGYCCVNRLALHDVDGDGELELLGSTSQISPRGRPRLYVWGSRVSLPVERAMARPGIGSSWSHALAFLPRPGQGPASIFITFCGMGEIVEYRMTGQNSTGEGFVSDNLGWKQVGQLPASGEWIQVADADNDGRPEVCVATGFAPGKAAIHFYESTNPGDNLSLRRRLDEDARFGNVRFLVTELGGGARDVIAWWCTDLAGGDCEVIAYRLGPEGVRRRTLLARGPAEELWSDDGQFVAGDVDGDGRVEVWFSTHAGHLWRYNPAGGAATPTALLRVARFEGGLGPIDIGPHSLSRRSRLYLGKDRSVLVVEPSAPGA